MFSAFDSTKELKSNTSLSALALPLYMHPHQPDILSTTAINTKEMQTQLISKLTTQSKSAKHITTPQSPLINQFPSTTIQPHNKISTTTTQQECQNQSIQATSSAAYFQQNLNISPKLDRLSTRTTPTSMPPTNNSAFNKFRELFASKRMSDIPMKSTPTINQSTETTSNFPAAHLNKSIQSLLQNQKNAINQQAHQPAFQELPGTQSIITIPPPISISHSKTEPTSRPQTENRETDILQLRKPVKLLQRADYTQSAKQHPSNIPRRREPSSQESLLLHTINNELSAVATTAAVAAHPSTQVSLSMMPPSSSNQLCTTSTIINTSNNQSQSSSSFITTIIPAAATTTTNVSLPSRPLQQFKRPFELSDLKSYKKSLEEELHQVKQIIQTIEKNAFASHALNEAPKRSSTSSKHPRPKSVRNTQETTMTSSESTQGLINSSTTTTSVCRNSSNKKSNSKQQQQQQQRNHQFFASQNLIRGKRDPLLFKLNHSRTDQLPSQIIINNISSNQEESQPEVSSNLLIQEQFLKEIPDSKTELIESLSHLKSRMVSCLTKYSQKLQHANSQTQPQKLPQQHPISDILLTCPASEEQSKKQPTQNKRLASTFTTLSTPQLQSQQTQNSHQSKIIEHSGTPKHSKEMRLSPKGSITSLKQQNKINTSPSPAEQQDQKNQQYTQFMHQSSTSTALDQIIREQNSIQKSKLAFLNQSNTRSFGMIRKNSDPTKSMISIQIDKLDINPNLFQSSSTKAKTTTHKMNRFFPFGAISSISSTGGSVASLVNNQQFIFSSPHHQQSTNTTSSALQNL